MYCIHPPRNEEPTEMPNKLALIPCQQYKMILFPINVYLLLIEFTPIEFHNNDSLLRKSSSAILINTQAQKHVDTWLVVIFSTTQQGQLNITPVYHSSA